MSETYHMKSIGVCSDHVRVDFAFEVHKEIDLVYVEKMWFHFLKYIKWKRNRQSKRIQRLVRITFHREKKEEKI